MEFETIHQTIHAQPIVRMTRVQYNLGIELSMRFTMKNMEMIRVMKHKQYQHQE